MPGKILVIEDDRNIAELISLYLTKNSYTVVAADNGREGLRIWNEQRPDLVILDLMLPFMDGWEVCQHMVSDGDTPIIVITAKGELEDKLRGFELGIDDYIVKPFDPLELVARVGAVRRRNDRVVQTGSNEVSISGLKVNLDTYQVISDNQTINLTPKETQLLYLLASHPGRVYTREYLLQTLWGYDYDGGTRTVDVHINRLRDKADTSKRSWDIRTVWGVGYKFEVKQYGNA